jgi:ABC-2 type transport system permease protein
VAFFLGIATIVIGAVRFAYMAGFLEKGNTFPGIAQYGGDLMAFLITGTLYMSFVGVSLNSFPGSIRSEQQMGTLEFLLLSDTLLLLILIYSAVWNYIWALLSTGIIFAVLVVGFHVSLDINLLPVFLILALSMLCISGIGLISAGVIMVTKMGDPITWIFSTLSGFLSGVLFPVEVLPTWMQKISAGLPPTYALSALRKALIVGAGLAEVQQEIAILALMSLITIPLGMLVFQWGFNKARRAGTLVEY